MGAAAPLQQAAAEAAPLRLAGVEGAAQLQLVEEGAAQLPEAGVASGLLLHAHGNWTMRAAY